MNSLGVQDAVRLKTERGTSERAVDYDQPQWRRLLEMRASSAVISKALLQAGTAMLYGSAARGDVRPTSDVDIVMLDGTAPFAVEIAFDAAGIEIVRREIVMATPNSPPKSHLVIDDLTTVSVPLLPLKAREEEFYRFGGLVRADDPKSRSNGIDKRLVLITPTERGHTETPVRGREARVAKALGVSVAIIEERVRVLDRRDEMGRTGVYLRTEVPHDEGVERFFARLSDRDPALRRAVRARGR